MPGKDSPTGRRHACPQCGAFHRFSKVYKPHTREARVERIPAAKREYKKIDRRTAVKKSKT